MLLFLSNKSILTKKIIILIFILLALLFYIDKVLMGPYAVIRFHDTFDSEFSKYINISHQMHKNGLTLWYPHHSGGLPTSAGHFSNLYVLNILSIILPLWLVYSFVVILLMFLAGYGMYRFLYEYMKLSQGLSLAGGIFFLLVSQVQPNNIPCVVFNYTFPVFFMWVIDISENTKTIKSKILSTLGILLVFWFSYPVLTLPFYSFLTLFLVLFMNFHHQHIKWKLIINAILIWIGYVFLCMPVIYNLFQYLPFVQREYQYTPLNALSLNELILNSFYFSFYYNAIHILTYISTIAGIVYFFSSKKIRRLYILLFIVVSFTTIGLSHIMGKTFFAKMDLSHFFWTLSFITTLITFQSIHELLKKKKSFIIILYILLAGMSYKFSLMNPFTPSYLIITNLMIILFSLCLYIYKFPLSGIIKFEKIKNKKILYSLLLITSIPIVSILYIVQFKIKPYPLNTILLFPNFLIYILIALGIIIVIIKKFIFIRSITIDHFNNIPIIIIISLGFLFFMQIRIIRFNGGQKEDIPYKKYFENHSILNKIKQEVLPFRAGVIDPSPNKLTYTALSYGIEMVDGRGPLFNKYYKDFFKLVIINQLKTENHHLSFKSWYDLGLINGNKQLNFNYPLLLFLNVKYLISKNDHKSLHKYSKEVLYDKSDINNYNGIMNKTIKSTYTAPIYIYKLRNTFERAFLIKNIHILPNDKFVLNTLKKQSISSLKNNAYYSKQDKDVPTPFILNKNEEKSFEKNVIHLKYYSPDKIIYTLKLFTPAVLILVNNYHPNWSASVNNKPAKIYRFNHAFQSIILHKKGEYTVVWQYKDPVTIIMYLLIILGCSIIFLPILIIYSKKPLNK